MAAALKYPLKESKFIPTPGGGSHLEVHYPQHEKDHYHLTQEEGKCSWAMTRNDMIGLAKALLELVAEDLDDPRGQG